MDPITTETEEATARPLSLFDKIRFGVGLLCWILELLIGGVALYCRLTHDFAVILMPLFGLPTAAFFAVIGGLLLPRQVREQFVLIFGLPSILSGLLILIAAIGFQDT